MGDLKLKEDSAEEIAKKLKSGGGCLGCGILIFSLILIPFTLWLLAWSISLLLAKFNLAL